MPTAVKPTIIETPLSGDTSAIETKDVAVKARRDGASWTI